MIKITTDSLVILMEKLAAYNDSRNASAEGMLMMSDIEHLYHGISKELRTNISFFDLKEGESGILFTLNLGAHILSAEIFYDAEEDTSKIAVNKYYPFEMDMIESKFVAEFDHGEQDGERYLIISD